MLLQYPEEIRGPEIEAKIIALEDTAWKSEEVHPVFPEAPHTYVTSFVLLEGEEAVCHVAVRKSGLFHKGLAYTAYGLSEVVTHPDYRRRGFASNLIKRAAAFIAQEGPDISIFTCAPDLAGFYAQGGWEAMPGVCFVGGTAEKPFRSDRLHLVTMMMFLSEKAKAHRSDFQNTDIVFELGENQLW